MEKVMVIKTTKTWLLWVRTFKRLAKKFPR